MWYSSDTFCDRLTPLDHKATYVLYVELLMWDIYTVHVEAYLEWFLLSLSKQYFVPFLLSSGNGAEVRQKETETL